MKRKTKREIYVKHSSDDLFTQEELYLYTFDLNNKKIMYVYIIFTGWYRRWIRYELFVLI